MKGAYPELTDPTEVSAARRLLIREFDELRLGTMTPELQAEIDAEFYSLYPWMAKKESAQ